MHAALPMLSRAVSAMGLAGAATMALSAEGAGTPAATASVAKPYQVVDATFACQQTTCEAELWLPAHKAGAGKPPVIVMAHGFGALKDWGLPAFAGRFVQAGFAVVRFDYRGFGKSGGQPRRVVDGREHVKDWLAAIDAIRLRPDVDGQRLGVWGTSYSGGQVLVAAAERPGIVKAVSAQVPFVNGFSSSLRYPWKYKPMAGWYAVRDLFRGDAEEPVYVPIVARDGFAALSCAECVDGYLKVVRPGFEVENKVAARVFMSLPFWVPGNRAADVQAPTLIIAAENDGLIPIEKVRDTARTLKQGEYLELKGADHFSPYTGPVFETVIARQAAFFVKHLQP